MGLSVGNDDIICDAIDAQHGAHNRGGGADGQTEGVDGVVGVSRGNGGNVTNGAHAGFAADANVVVLVGQVGG